MAINGKIGSLSRDDERAQSPGHGPVLQSGALLAAQGVFPVGLILTRDANGKLIPYAEVTGEVLGTGDGSTAAFTGTLSVYPVEPGSLVVTDGVETFRDDGYGRLVGDAGGSGTIDYEVGAVAVTFNANVADGTDVTVDFVTAIEGVLDEKVDTAYAASGNYIPHGTVRRDVLKVGISDPAAPSATLLARLTKKGIYAR